MIARFKCFWESLRTSYKAIKRLLRKRDEEGQRFVEYGLILGLIAVVAIATMNATGSNINHMLRKIASTPDTTS